jgi:hypothetical protein
MRVSSIQVIQSSKLSHAQLYTLDTFSLSEKLLGVGPAQLIESKVIYAEIKVI